MQIVRCVNCMEELEGGVCPKCGFDHEKNQQPPIGLKWNSVIHGRYLVGRVLGQGGFGITYVGFDLLLNIKVAIKEYFPMGNVSRDHSMSNTLQWNPTMLEGDAWKQGCESFLREARKMAKIDSVPGIVRVRDTFYENQTAYIVMDFIEGATLKATLLKNGTMNYAECLQMLAPLMRSLDKVHAQGLIHRDISPDNIMIQTDGELRLLDLGAAKDTTANREGVSQLVMKRGFSPAEQYMENGSIGGWTDVYALCATIYYCIYGKVIPDAMERLMQDTLVFPPSPKGDVPEDVVAALRDGLAVKAEDRIQSMSELLDRLANYVSYGSSTDLHSTAKLRQGMQTGNVANQATDNVQGEGTKKKLSQKEKRLIPIVAGSVGVIVVLIVLISVLHPFRTRAKRLGNTNANMVNDGAYAVMDMEYEYYLDHDYNLMECVFDEEDQMFYVDESRLIAENACYINVGENSSGEDCIYFTQSDADGYNICAWIPGSEIDDTSRAESLYYTDYTIFFLDYVETNYGGIYLYFMQVEENNVYYLYRYNLATNTTEQVLQQDIAWYNICGDSIYYLGLDDESGYYLLSKARLNGSHAKVLDEEQWIGYGFIEENQMMLYSYDEEAIVILDMKGNEIRALHDVDLDKNVYNFGYGDGWIYYQDASDNSVHRIRTDGTGDSVVEKDMYAVSLCYMEDSILIREGSATDTSGTIRRTYLAYKDGSSLLELDEPEEQQTDNGLLYKQDGDNIIITGYEGTAKDVGVPYYIDGYPVTEIEDDALPDDVYFYLYLDKTELVYKYNEDNTGYIITGYNSSQTVFMLPDCIDDIPIVAIGEEAFKEADIERIALGQYVTEIQKSAFEDCDSLYHIGIPAGLKSLGEYAFDSCSALTDISLPYACESIGFDCFSYSGLQSIEIRSRVSDIAGGAFSNCNIGIDDFVIDTQNQYYVYQDGILYTKDMTRVVYCNPNLSGEVRIPEGVTVIGEWAFEGCDKITKVVLPSTTSTLENDAFWNCSQLSELEMPENVEIGRNAFWRCDALELEQGE